MKKIYKTISSLLVLTLVIVSLATVSAREIEQITQTQTISTVVEDQTITPIILSGKGQTATAQFYLPQGLIKLELSHDGTSNFIIELIDNQGKTKDYIVNEIGKFSGSKTVGIDIAGNYLLNVNADGNWNVKTSSVPIMSPTPSTLSGKGFKSTDLFYLHQGLVTFEMSHDEKSN